MSDPIRPVAVALRGILNGHASLTALGVAAGSVHWPVAPEGRTFPYVLLETVDAPEEDRTFTGATWTRQTWKVTAVTEEDASLASNIAGAVHALIEGAELTLTGYRCMETPTRLRAIPPMPTEGTDGKVRFKAGADYEIGVGETA